MSGRSGGTRPQSAARAPLDRYHGPDTTRFNPDWLALRKPADTAAAELVNPGKIEKHPRVRGDDLLDLRRYRGKCTAESARRQPPPVSPTRQHHSVVVDEHVDPPTGYSAVEPTWTSSTPESVPPLTCQRSRHAVTPVRV